MSPRALARVCKYRWGEGPGTWESAEGPNGALGRAAAWGDLGRKTSGCLRWGDLPLQEKQTSLRDSEC